MYCWKCGHKNSEIAVYCEKCGASLCEPNSSYKETRANAQTNESKRAAAKQTEPNRSSERTSHPAARSEAADNIQTAHEAVDSARAVISNLGNQVQQTAFNTKQQKIGLSFSFGFNQKMMVLATLIAIVASFLGFSSKELTSTSYLGGSYVAMGYWWFQPIWIIATVLGCYGLPLIGVATGGISLVVILNSLIRDAGFGFSVGVGAVLLVAGTTMMVVFHLRAVLGRNGKDLFSNSELENIKQAAKQVVGNMSNTYQDTAQKQGGGSPITSNETAGNEAGKKWCPNCGAMQDESAKFCGKCGHRFE